MRLQIFVLLIFSISVKGQDSLNVDLLSKISHSFVLKEGEISGDGKEFLEEELASSQFTMLGEYHGSKNISLFTKAIIPFLDQNGYRHFALEVGPISAQVLSELTSNPSKSIEHLHDFHSQYSYLDDGYYYFAMPFFENLEDAQFLNDARARKWNLMGIDQEFIFSFEMLWDRIFEKMSTSNKELYRNRHVALRDSISTFTTAEADGSGSFTILFRASKEVLDYLEILKKDENVKEIVDAILKTIEIYGYYDDRKYYQNNKVRIDYMKKQLALQMMDKDFDLKKDKMMIKMGSVHLSKGRSPLGLLDVGNTLNELAAFNGNKVINISFMNRYVMEDGETKDYLEENSKYLKDYFHLLQMGKKDEWVVIDLRRLHKGIVYYPVRHLVTEKVKDLISRYDLLIITPIEKEGTPNYSLK